MQNDSFNTACRGLIGGEKAPARGRASNITPIMIALLFAVVALYAPATGASADEFGRAVVNAPAQAVESMAVGAVNPDVEIDARASIRSEQGFGSEVIRRGSGRSRSNGATEKSGGTSSSMSGLRMWIPLIIVLTVIAGVAWMARRMFPRLGRVGQDGAITVLSRHALSPRQSLCLIRMGRRVVLLGVTPDSINTLVDVCDAEEASMLTAAAASRRPDSFSHALAAMTRAYRRPPEESEARDVGTQAAGLSSLVSRVRGMARRETTV